MLVGDQSVARVEPEPDLSRLNLVRDGLTLEQSDCELTRGDLVRLWHEVDVDWTDVALRFLLTVITGTTISWSEAPPWTYRVPAPGWGMRWMDFGI